MPSLILKRSWSFKKPEKGLIQDLSSRLSFPGSIVSYLVARGLRTVEDVESHLDVSLSSLSDPFLMKGMNRGARRLIRALEARERIGIFGDYDADGVTSSALVFLFLRELGLECHVYIPHREEEGYGLNRQGLDYLRSRGCRLVITVDCGITNCQEAKYASDKGVDLIITDHHQPQEQLPSCLAVINPRQPGCRFPFKDLAGVGVAFNLMRALRSLLYRAGYWNGGNPPNLRKYLDLVAIGTVSDIVPLFGDNRIMVKTGLQVLEEGGRPGVDALMQVSSLSGSVTSTDIGFRLGPRINAAGRMDHAEKAFHLLVSQDESEAASLAGELNTLNQLRQSQERQILRQALSVIEGMGRRDSYVLASPKWKLGIIGIVASKIVEQVNRPVLMLSVDGREATGSGRCPEGLDLFSLLSACSSCLTRYGGHKAAAGLKLDIDRLDDFRRLFEQESRKGLAGGKAVPVLQIDCRVHAAELANPDYPMFLEMLEPFGPGYSGPVFSMKNFSVKDRRIVGKSHLKLTLSGQEGARGRQAGIDLVAWGHGDKLSFSWNDMEIAFTPGINNWQGRRSLQLVLKDARPKTP